jgi:sulfur carrier protein ThiS
MKVLIRIPEQQEYDLDMKRCRVSDVLKLLKYEPDEVIVIRGSELLTKDELLNEDDVIEVRPAISGGAT